jgi:hypothetical protein
MTKERLREVAYKACYWPGHKMGLPRERCRECLRTLEALRTAQAEAVSHTGSGVGGGCHRVPDSLGLTR